MAVAMSGAEFPPARSVPPEGQTPASIDSATLARCRAQDKLAFRIFVARHERMVFALLSRMLGHGPDAEDLAQETFVRAYCAFPGFDPSGPAKVSTWLLTIATRLALDSRKRRKLAIAEVDDENEPRAASDPELRLERRELGQAIAVAASKLPDEQRAALVLAEFHGLSIAEIAGALDVPESTAKTRLFRAREKMRHALATEWRPR